MDHEAMLLFIHVIKRASSSAPCHVKIMPLSTSAGVDARLSEPLLLLVSATTLEFPPQQRTSHFQRGAGFIWCTASIHGNSATVNERGRGPRMEVTQRRHRCV